MAVAELTDDSHDERAPEELTLYEKQEKERLEFCEQLKAKHNLKRVFIVRIQRADTDELPDHDPEKFTFWYLRGPKPIEAMRFNTEGLDESKKPRAMSNLVWPCLLFPVGQELEQLKQELPLAYMTLGNKLCEIAGLDSNATIKKT